MTSVGFGGAGHSQSTTSKGASATHPKCTVFMVLFVSHYR